MQPYQINPGLSKFINGNDQGGIRGHTKQDKLITKNANRGRKKAYRQYLKRMIWAKKPCGAGSNTGHSS